MQVIVSGRRTVAGSWGSFLRSRRVLVALEFPCRWRTIQVGILSKQPGLGPMNKISLVETGWGKD